MHAILEIKESKITIVKFKIKYMFVHIPFFIEIKEVDIYFDIVDILHKHLDDVKHLNVVFGSNIGINQQTKILNLIYGITDIQIVFQEIFAIYYAVSLWEFQYPNNVKLVPISNSFKDFTGFEYASINGAIHHVVKSLIGHSHYKFVA
jgi:hypothetical protein